MKTLSLLSLLLLTAGCDTVSSWFPPPPANQPRLDWWARDLGQREGLRGYRVRVESSAPARIEVDGELVATLTNAPGEIILWADGNGTFRDNRTIQVVAYPIHGGTVQTRLFPGTRQRTYVPHAIYFDLSLDAVLPVIRYDIKNH